MPTKRLPTTVGVWMTSPAGAAAVAERLSVVVVIIPCLTFVAGTKLSPALASIGV